MEIFLYKKNLIENCEKNYNQTCSKQKIVNVSSVNECHKIDTSSQVRKTEHMRSRQICQAGPRWRPNREIGIKSGYYFMYGTQIGSVLLRRNAITITI